MKSRLIHFPSIEATTDRPESGVLTATFDRETALPREGKPGRPMGKSDRAVGDGGRSKLPVAELTSARPRVCEDPAGERTMTRHGSSASLGDALRSTGPRIKPGTEGEASGADPGRRSRACASD